MSEVKIYHNNRCSKSRAGVKFLEEKGIDATVIKYMDGISESELTDVLQKLGMRPLELMRTKEELFRKEYKGKDLSDTEWIAVMVANPKLIERPIIVKGDKAVVARPTEKIDEVLG